MRGPAAVDGKRRAGDLSRGIGAKKHGERAELLDGNELLRRLRGQEHVLDYLLLSDTARFGLIWDLFPDERRHHVSGTNRVAGHAMLGTSKSSGLGQPDEAVLRRHVGRLEWRCDEAVS